MYGIQKCEGDVIHKCKPGYMGDRCQFCEAEELIISGTNGVVDVSNGFGVNCSKYNYK